MTISMLEYLAGLRRHGSEPLNIGEATIGRTVYAAGSFRNPRGATRIALMPMYRKDWVSREPSDLATPALLPASYVRSRNTIYYTASDYWYISGYQYENGVLWLDRSLSTQHHDKNRVYMDVHWRESFQTALQLASSEVLTRIADHLKRIENQS